MGFNLFDPLGITGKSERGITELFEAANGDFVSEKIRDWVEGLFDEESTPITIQRQGSNFDIPIIYGTREIGGIIVDRNTTDEVGGVFNEYLHLLVVWCAGEIDEVSEIYFDEYSENDQRFNKEGGGKWFTTSTHTGAIGQAADPDVIANFNNADTNSKLESVAYTYIRLEMDEGKTIWRGIPKITARIKGRKVYDPRSTLTEYSENPALCLLDYLKDPIYSKGLVDNDILIPFIELSADYAEEQQDSDIQVGVTTYLYPGDVGYPLPPSDPQYGRPQYSFELVNELGQINRFSCNTIIDTKKTIFNNVKMLLRQFRGFMILEGGKLKLINEGAGDPVMLFDDSNIVGNIQSQGPRKNSRLHRCQVQFTNKRNRYKNDIVAYPATTDPLYAQWLAEDNGIVLDKKLTYEGITEKAEALRMAETAVKVSRDNGTCSFTAKYIAIKLQPADIIGVTDETRGWIEKPFRVATTQQQPNGLVKLSCVEHNSTAYPWEQLDYDDEIGGTWLGDPNNILAPGNLVLSLDETLATLGNLSWTYNTDGFVRMYRIDIVRDSDGVVVLSKEERAKSTNLPLIAVGSYTINVYAVSTTGYTSAPAVLVLNASIPAPPDGITLTPGDFDMYAQPTMTGGLILGNQYEFGLNSTVVQTRGATATFTNLLADTPYTVYARTINAFGVSAWVNNTASTTDGQKIIDIVGDFEVDLSDLDIPPDTWDGHVAEVRDIFGDLVNSSENLVNEAEIAEESRVRNEQLAIVDAELIELDATLDELNTVTIPAMQVEIGLLNNVTLVNVQEDLDNLNGVELPALQAQLNQAEIDIAANESDITTLNTVTLPALSQDILDNETAIDTLNTVTLPALSQDILDNETAIDTLNTVTLPALSQDILDNEAAITTLNTVTIPALDFDITANETAITTLNTVTIPALEQDLTDIDDRFPIQNVDIGDDQISAPKISANAITAVKIIAGAITTDKMTANTINGDRITANTLNASKITAGSITTDRMTANSIDGDRITANTLNADKIVAGSITTDRMTADSIDGNRITTNTLNGNRVIAGSITSNLMTANTINGDRLTVNTVNGGKIIAGSITTDKMTANTINGDRLTVNTVSGGKIIAGSITTDKMTANTINGDRITAGTLNANKIIANSITGNEIAANSIGTNEMIANSITANEIAANSIYSGAIQSNSIDTSELISLSVTTDKINTFAIIADKISANAVTTDKLIASAVVADKIATDAIITRHLVANQIEGQHLKVNTINAREINAFAITALEIAANTITAGQIAANTITANEINVNQVLADEIFAENITATGTITGASLVGSTVAAFGDVINTIPLYSQSSFSGGFLGGGAIRGDYSGSGFSGDSPQGASVIGNYTGSDVFAAGVKGVGGSGLGGAFYTSSNQTCVTMFGGSSRCLEVNTSGFAGIHVINASDIGVLIDSNLTNPTQAGLKVVETSAFAGVRSSGGTWDFYADNGSGSYGPFTGGHDGLVLKSFTAEQGDIVCDVDVIAKNGVSDAILSMELSSKPMQKSSAGAFVLQHELNEINRPAAMKGLNLDDYSQFNAITFNALGEGLMNVCGEGGDIEKGDYICTSSIAGKGMKQPLADDLKSYTVAQSREDVIFNSTTEVKQIAVIYKAG